MINFSPGREATPQDHVCVTPARRDDVREIMKLRRVVPSLQVLNPLQDVCFRVSKCPSSFRLPDGSVDGNRTRFGHTSAADLEPSHSHMDFYGLSARPS